GRGFLTATINPSELGEEDFRSRNPRFAGEAGQANLAIADAVRGVASAEGVAPAQVALAWVYAQAPRLGVPVVPIPGTKRINWLEQNVDALDVRLTPEELAVLDGMVDKVSGSRY
ncbi:MAG: aldo/keto reductase, partial [Streptosporangiaceae bacterium]